VTAEMEYAPPGGALGKVAAASFGKEPGIHHEEDLRRVKALLEIREIPTTEGQPHGPRSAVISAVHAVYPERRKTNRIFSRRTSCRAKESVMKAVCWMGTEKMSVETVPGSEDIESARCDCGDHEHVHLRIGPAICTTSLCRPWSRATLPGTSSWARLWKWARAWTKGKLRVGDRVVVPFTIAWR